MAVGRFFFLCSPDCPKKPRTSFLFYKFFSPTISGRISAAIPFLQLFLPEDVRFYYLREFLSREESYNKKSAILTFTTKPKWHTCVAVKKRKKKRRRKKEIPSLFRSARTSCLEMNYYVQKNLGLRCQWN